MRTFGRVAAFTAAVPFVASSVSGASAAAPPTSELSDDVTGYANLYGISAAEAERQMALEDALPAVAAALRDRLAADFAGLWMTHEPGFALHVSGTGDHAADVTDVVAGTVFEGITSFETAALSFTDLEAAAEGATSGLKVPHAVDIDVVHNRVVLLVEPKNRGQAEKALRRGVELNVVERLGGPTAEIYAGLPLSGGCTTGFTVRGGSGATGVTTAAHCVNSEAYSGTNLPFQGERLNTTDVQWHTTPNLTDAPKIKLGSTTYRYVTGHLSYTDVFPGSTVCKYGNTTKYGCGEVNSTTFRPSWISPNSPYFGKVENCGVDMSTGGDSGGPVFRNGSAVGIVSGWHNNPLLCSTDQMVFGFLYPFATDYLDIGVLVQ